MVPSAAPTVEAGANVLQMSTVRAVVLETTGDISVLHGDGALHPDLLYGVVRRRLNYNSGDSINDTATSAGTSI